jgi:hypothetical protein
MLRCSPVPLIPLVLRKIQKEKPDIWLVYLRFLRPLDQLALESLPIKFTHALGPHTSTGLLVTPTPQVPTSLRQGEWRTPL